MNKSAGGETHHKVLLVDDDAVSLELMALLLAHEGHQVLRANDAGAALELLAGETTVRPDVLLVDLQMPEFPADNWPRRSARWAGRSCGCWP